MSELIKKTFDAVCDDYDHAALAFFSNSATSLTGRLAFDGGEQVLDVATGTGHVALSIADSLPGGHITAIDFSPGMLECARQKARNRGVTNIEFREMDMQRLAVEPASFDAAVCAFGIFFVEDMLAQLKSMSAAVRAGGTVAISTFEQDHFFNPLVDLMFARLKNYGVEKPPQTWRQVASEPGCRELFERAGLTNIRVDYENVGYYLDGADAWWSVLWNGGFRRLLDQLSSADRERFRAEHLKEIDELRTAEGIWLDVGVLFTLGQKTPPIRGLPPRGPG